MQESEQFERFQIRSIPRNAYVHVRCLDCGEIQSHNSTSLMDTDTRDFVSSVVFEHTALTGHRVVVTVTESFNIEPLR